MTFVANRFNVDRLIDVPDARACRPNGFLPLTSDERNAARLWSRPRKMTRGSVARAQLQVLNAHDLVDG